MKIINKIKAFFTKDDEPMEMDIVAAEIREGKAHKQIVKVHKRLRQERKAHISKQLSELKQAN